MGRVREVVMRWVEWWAERVAASGAWRGPK